MLDYSMEYTMRPVPFITAELPTRAPPVWPMSSGGVVKLAFLTAKGLPECSWDSELALLGVRMPFNFQDVVVPLVRCFAVSHSTGLYFSASRM